MAISKGTNAHLHRLLNDTGQTSNKAILVYGFTMGRTEHSSQMTEEEAAEMIRFLSAKFNAGSVTDGANKMRRKIIAMAHKMHWYDERGKLDMARINAWCVYKGYLHKELMQHDESELPKLVTQFQQVYASFLGRQ